MCEFCPVVGECDVCSDETPNYGYRIMETKNGNDVGWANPYTYEEVDRAYSVARTMNGYGSSVFDVRTVRL